MGRAVTPNVARRPAGRALARAAVWLRADVRVHAIAWGYLAIALVWGVAMALITPPFQVPDEAAHYYRAWSVAEVELIGGEGRIVVIPENVAALPGALGSLVVDWSGNQYSVDKALDLLWEPISADQREEMSTAAGYGPIGYLPQVVGIDVARVLGRSPLLGFYLARLANLLASALLVFFAVRLVPFGKGLIALVGLLPMFVFQAASLSPDGLALSGMLLFLALVLRMAGREALTTLELVLMVSAAALLLNAKAGSVALVLLVFMLRPGQVGGVRRYALWTGGAVLASVGVAGAIMAAAPAVPPAYLASIALGRVDPAAQLDYMVSHPWGFAKVLYRTFDAQAVALTQAAYGLLGWLTVRLPAVGLYGMGVAAILLLGVREEIPTTRRQRLVMGGVALAYTVAVCAAAYRGWSVLRAPVVDGLQGRYFIPVLALALFTVYGVRVRRRRAIVLILAAAAVVAALTTVRTLLRFYY